MVAPAFLPRIIKLEECFQSCFNDCDIMQISIEPKLNLLSSQHNHLIWNESRNRNWTYTSFTMTCVLTAQSEWNVWESVCLLTLTQFKSDFRVRFCKVLNSIGIMFFADFVHFAVKIALETWNFTWNFQSNKNYSKKGYFLSLFYRKDTDKM